LSASESMNYIKKTEQEELLNYDEIPFLVKKLSESGFSFLKEGRMYNAI